MHQPDPPKPAVAADPPGKRRLPILARHAVSLCVVFALALPLSYLAGRHLYRQARLSQLEQADGQDFEKGLAYVYEHAAASASVTDDALSRCDRIQPQRAAQLLVTVAMSYAKLAADPPPAIEQAAQGLMQRQRPEQAIALYDTLLPIAGLDGERLGGSLLEAVPIAPDPSCLPIIELLEQRLLWSRDRVPRDKWLNWLAVLAESSAELTQHQAARLLGAMPDDVDDVRVSSGLWHLRLSSHDSVRAAVLHACAGYAAIAKDPTPYEQAIFELGSDPNPAIARRAWMIVGHLKPASGFAVNWQDAELPVAQAMLWAAAMTNPDNPQAVWQAHDNPQTRARARYALGELTDNASVARFVDAYGTHEKEDIDIDPARLVDLIQSPAGLDPGYFATACASLLDQGEAAGDVSAKLLRMHTVSAQQLGALLAAMSGARPTLIFGDYKALLASQPDLTSEQLHAMSDSELSSFGLRRVDALDALLRAALAAPPSAQRQSEIDLLRLALWTRGDLGEDFTPTAEAMLYSDALPTTSVLMCLLHKRRPVALDYLLGDASDPPPDLHALLVQQRFWHALDKSIDTAGLSLWLWADAQDQAFQLESMRQWHAVRRWQIERGWWPQRSDAPR